MKLIFGPKFEVHKYERNAYVMQCEHVKRVWNDETEMSFGITRWIRLILALLPFLTPGLLIRFLSGLKNNAWRKISTEIFVVFKLAFPIYLLTTDLCYKLCFQILIVWLMLDGLIYISGIIFLSDTHNPPLSIKRSVLLTMVNYFEITLDFAVLYKGLKLLEIPKEVFAISSNGLDTIKNAMSGISNITSSQPNTLVDTLEAIYFSFITSTTLGYGDYLPKHGLGQIIVICQVITMLIFVVIFVNHFISLREKSNKNIKENVCIDEKLNEKFEEAMKLSSKSKAMLLEYFDYLEFVDNQSE